MGVMPLPQAREMARKSSLDLVEVAPTAVPPVCRLLDYGKFKYAHFCYLKWIVFIIILAIIYAENVGVKYPNF